MNKNAGVGYKCDIGYRFPKPKPVERTGRAEFHCKDSTGHACMIGATCNEYEVELAERLFFLCYGRANWFHRLMQRLCFGFKWSRRMPIKG